MEKEFIEEIYRADPDLFAAPKCYVRERSAAELGISQQAKDALLLEYTIPDTSCFETMDEEE